MTNEDAIKILKEHCYVFNPLDFDKTTMINTALDTAVRTLERQTIIKKEIINGLHKSFYSLIESFSDDEIAKTDFLIGLLLAGVTVHEIMEGK